MSTQYARPFSRRRFLRGVTLVGTVGLLGWHPRPTAAEPPPETPQVRLIRSPDICLAPLYMAEELLRGEGFTDVQYVQGTGGQDDIRLAATGATDFIGGFVGRHLAGLDAGDPIVILSGLHIGCFELFGNQRVRSIRDLKGKQVAVTRLTSGRHIFLSVMAGYVGLDPRQDLTWVTDPAATSMQRFADGHIDAFMAFPPEPQELRAKQIGHVVVNTTMDRPWSQYFCCMVVANRDFVRQHPVATKRALRAILKANSVCALEPVRSARTLVDKWYPATNYDYALQTIKELPYGQWREYDPEDTVRFYALRMHEVGMIKSSPQQMIAQGTDWRFLNELKKELKE
ncbi:MAG TPA: ABC transporter substrate-binding protein [Candidatus Tectomicrobia bacterium]|nr:ABC transporter substrate-binding protein [Candidatus Tectomicrobia bacterium]